MGVRARNEWSGAVIRNMKSVGGSTAFLLTNGRDWSNLGLEGGGADMRLLRQCSAWIGGDEIDGSSDIRWGVMG